MSAEAQHERFVIERTERRIRLAGTFRMVDCARAWRELTSIVTAEEELFRSEELSIDLSGVERIDGGVVALIVAARSELADHGVRSKIAAMPEELRPLFELYGALGEHARPRARAANPDGLTRLGDATVRGRDALRAALAFLGDVADAVVALVRRPRLVNLKEIPSLLLRAGPDALPILVMISGLVGFVMGYQSARQLERFGANVYVADLVGIAITRELGPLMTAIILAGRSGAAFAAELATMKVRDELDALRTMGFRPVAWLVLPRVAALALAMPVLVLVSDVVGVLGGLFVATLSLDVTPRAYLLELERTLEPWDVMQGLIKSVPFAVTIALIACQQGFAATGGPESVGRRTTATVVVNLFALVLLDAVFTLTFRLLGK